MLVLSRKANESIQIGDNVTVEVRKIAGNRVTIAINAPREVRILRGELQQAATEFEATELEVAAEEPAEDEVYEVAQARVKLSGLHRAFPQGSPVQAVG